jgi:glycosyltransferase involved in cell wall biosynthesis
LGVEKSSSLDPLSRRVLISRISELRPRRFTQPLKRMWWNRRHLNRANILHPTYYNLTGGLRFSDIHCPVVITIHDLIAVNFPHLEPDSDYTIRILNQAVERADRLICVSHATKADLLQHYPHVAEKTTVIHHGSSFPICLEAQRDDIFEEPMFLYVGRRTTYKNFPLLLRALSRACRSHPRIRLHIAGSPLTDEERWQIHFLGLSDRVNVTVYPNEQELHRLYRHSMALLYPSRLEGFGLPPLEAMACGTLAVTSNVSSLPEIVGDGGILLNPDDELAWTDCILQIANNSIERPALIERGKRRASTLSWEQSAKSHIELYKELAAR